MRRRAACTIVLAALLPTLGAVPAAAERTEKGNLVIEGIPEIPPELSERLRQYQNTRLKVSTGRRSIPPPSSWPPSSA